MQMVLKTTTTPVDGDATTTTETLNFTYDASGTPMSVKYDNTTYYYVVNIQGDIMAILNTSGTAVVEYTYDAWGKQYSTNGTLADTLGEVNPLTYRGYVYDHDSGYYYLQSRYYDPEMGRFINGDSYASTGLGILACNMFAYCGNNPCIHIDPTGHEHFVGYGFQVDISTDHGTFGFEVVIYTDDEVAANTTGDPEKDYVVVIYTYSGVSVNQYEMALSPHVAEIVSSLDLEELNSMSTDEALITLVGVLSNYQLSGSAFAIFGNDSFESADDYSGSFETWSLMVSGTSPIYSGGVFRSTSSTCTVYGGRFSGSCKPRVRLFPIDVTYSATYYSDPIILF